MTKKLFYCIAFIFTLTGHSLAQTKSSVKFGDISEKDLAPTHYSIDSNANAVIIADIGSSNIEGNQNGWFSLKYTRYKRVHILNKNGYDAANFSIPLYTNGINEERIDKVRAVTYNNENGKVVETKLDIKSGIFSDRISKNLVIKKFTLPNVKVGSIIEVEYTIISDFLNNLQPWEFQGSYPELWSEYKLSLPDFLGYVFISQGYHGFDINEKNIRSEGFRVIDSRGTQGSETYNFTSGVTDYRWAMKNVWALKEENFTSTLNNHIAKIEFQWSEIRSPLNPKNVMGTWQDLAKQLLESEFFGRNLDHDNGWLRDIVKPFQSVSNPLDKAKAIYNWVRSNYTSTGYDYSLDQPLKTIAKGRSGNVAEINLLLTALLKTADINAEPVILSTKAHGFTFPLYPVPSKFNYAICQVVIGGKTYYLDASEPRMGFGHLPLRCYNGHARMITKECPAIELSADSVLEKSSIGYFVIPNDSGALIGSVQEVPGYYESTNIRNMARDQGLGDVQRDIRKGFNTDIEITSFRIDSLDNYDVPVGLRYQFKIPVENEDIIYFNPMFGEAQKENPFKSAERFYPVEIPYVIDETYILHFELPPGYEVDELPKSILVKLNEQGEGAFEYRISQSNNIVSLRSRIRLNRAYFLPEEYEMLRAFYDLIVAKHAELIALKKKK